MALPQLLICPVVVVMSSLLRDNPESTPICHNCFNLDLRLVKSSRAHVIGPDHCACSLDSIKLEQTAATGCKFCGLVSVTAEWLLPNRHHNIIPSISLISGKPLCIHLPFGEAHIFGTTPNVMTWGVIPYVPPFPASPQLRESFEFVKQEIYHCASNHPQCCERSVSTAPKRLLDVRSGIDSVRLTVSDAQSRERYACLSYCWGGYQTLKLTKTTEPSLSDSISWESLPILFQNAISVCRRLGIPFLWIDALCIFQGEDEQDEWKQEAAHMADIYQNAFVPIFAASSSSPDQSFLHREYDPNTTTTLVYDDTGSPLIMARQKHSSGLHLEYGRLPRLDPLERRAWVFQEYHLSRRAIIYASNEEINISPLLN